jgi:hypothetical protein
MKTSPRLEARLHAGLVDPVMRSDRGIDGTQRAPIRPAAVVAN